MNGTWASTTKDTSLEPGQIHLWRIQLDDPATASLLASAYDLLSPEEQQRAARMRSGIARDEFIAARGSLRWLLARALATRNLQLAPALLPIEVATHGKPLLALAGAPQFSVSHSQGLILIALADAESAVGVDLEAVDRNVEALHIAEDHFTASEFQQIQAAADGPERNTVFYRCWTRKEAITKADGRGLGLPLNSFTVGGAPEPEQPVRLVHGTASATFFLQDLAVDPGFAAALASARPITIAYQSTLNALAFSPTNPIQGTEHHLTAQLEGT